MMESCARAAKCSMLYVLKLPRKFTLFNQESINVPKPAIIPRP